MAPRKLLDVPDDEEPELSSMAARTRPRLETEPLVPLHVNIPQPQTTPPPSIDTELTLYICCAQQSPRLPEQPPSSSQLPPAQQQLLPDPQPQLPPPPPPRRYRRKPTNAPRHGKPLTVPPPFPWATDRRAKVHSLTYLLERNITKISGDVQCKRCDRCYKIEYNLEEKFLEVAGYMVKNMHHFSDRAPHHLLNPIELNCNYCHQQNSVKPKMAKKKKAINWLFLLLSEFLGCCTLGQLKYFCKHTGNHRTGAKDRVLYLAYLGLCKQLDPSGPFYHGKYTIGVL